jgi:hypothetical protein
MFYKFPFGYFAVVYSDVKIAVWMRANPGLETDLRPVPPVIGQRQQDSLIAF